MPLPFSPVMPTFSPRYRLNVAFSNSTRVPRRTEMSVKFSMAGQDNSIPPRRQSHGVFAMKSVSFIGGDVLYVDRGSWFMNSYQEWLDAVPSTM